MTASRRPPGRTVFETPWFSVEAVPDRDGSMDPPYYRLVSGEGVAAFPVTDQGEFVLVEQYRPTLGATTLEFPAGERESNETECFAAARETYEETGYLCDFWVPIAPCRMMLNRTDHRDYFVIGFGARQDPDWRQHEATEPKLLSRPRFIERTRADMFEHTSALAAISLLEIKFGLRMLTDPVDQMRDALAPHGQIVRRDQLVGAEPEPDKAATQA